MQLEYLGASIAITAPAWTIALAIGAIVLVAYWKYYQGEPAQFGKLTRDYAGGKEGDMVHKFL